VTTTAAGEIRTVAWRLQGRARPPRTRLAGRPASDREAAGGSPGRADDPSAVAGTVG